MVRECVLIVVEKGEEVYMSYGSHPNDFLFAECEWDLCLRYRSNTTEDGFFLDENDCETLYLDDIIFRDLSPSQQDELYHQQYYGYVLHSSKKLIRDYFMVTTANLTTVTTN